MKVIATSQVPKEVPYLHLGYLSAYSDGQTGWRKPPNYAGPVVIVVIGTFIITAAFGFFKAWKWRIVGGVLGCAILAAGIASAIMVAKAPAQHRERVTQGRMSTLVSVMQDDKWLKLPERKGDRVKVGEALDVEGLKLDFPASVDGWGNHMMFEKIDDDTYTPVSAGPDGKFDTDDDFRSKRYRFSQPKSKPKWKPDVAEDPSKMPAPEKAP